MIQILFDLVKDRFGNPGMVSHTPLSIRLSCDFEEASLCYETWCCVYRISCLHTETQRQYFVQDTDLYNAAKKAIGACYPDD